MCFPAAQVTTSDIKGAGTDAGIEINLLGATGETGYHPLMANYDTFERGQVCVAKKLNLDLRLRCSAGGSLFEVPVKGPGLREWVGKQ